MSNYQICTKCIMDTSDPNITFDDNGVCNHCHDFNDKWNTGGYKGSESDEKLLEVINQIKADGKGKKYDCILGISGGVDSSYLAHLSTKYDLRVLAVHVDAGWNSDVAVQNIFKICKKLNINLYTEVLDWETIKELQRTYMFSGLANLDIPQDHAFLAGVYDYAIKYNIKYMLNGSNYATEGILPKAWGYSALDYRSIRSVFTKFKRKGNLRKYPHFGVVKYFTMRNKIKRVNLLNHIPYSKTDAIKLLSEEYDWKYYGGKHFESRFTKFFQSYYLPRKFGYDKRRAHLSSLIVSGEMDRKSALVEMDNTTAYPLDEMLEDRDYILKKLEIPLNDWNSIMSDKNKTEDDYKSNKKLLEFLIRIKKIMKRFIR